MCIRDRSVDSQYETVDYTKLYPDAEIEDDGTPEPSLVRHARQLTPDVVNLVDDPEAVEAEDVFDTVEADDLQDDVEVEDDTLEADDQPEAAPKGVINRIRDRWTSFKERFSREDADSSEQVSESEQELRNRWTVVGVVGATAVAIVASRSPELAAAMDNGLEFAGNVVGGFTESVGNLFGGSGVVEAVGDAEAQQVIDLAPNAIAPGVEAATDISEFFTELPITLEPGESVTGQYADAFESAGLVEGSAAYQDAMAELYEAFNAANPDLVGPDVVDDPAEFWNNMAAGKEYNINSPKASFLEALFARHRG